MSHPLNFNCTVYNVQLRRIVMGPFRAIKARKRAIRYIGEYDPFPRTLLVIDEAGQQIGPPVENFAARYERMKA